MESKTTTENFYVNPENDPEEKKNFWQKHKKKILLAGGIIISAFATGLACYYYKKITITSSNLYAPPIVPNLQDSKSQQLFCGVPVDDLDALAKSIHHGKRAYVYKGYLIFEYTSNSNKTTFRPQLRLNEDGNLINLGGHYQGQWWSPSDEFAKQANILFKFVPEKESV